MKIKDISNNLKVLAYFLVMAPFWVLLLISVGAAEGIWRLFHWEKYNCKEEK